MGRPTKLTPEVQKVITDAIAIGASYHAASEYAGVATSTFNLWLTRKGKRYVEFSEAVRGANAKARVNLLAHIQKPAQNGDWRAAAWILERRFPDEFKPTAKIEIDDWRKDAAEAGVDPDALVEDLFRKVAVKSDAGNPNA